MPALSLLPHLSEDVFWWVFVVQCSWFLLRNSIHSLACFLQHQNRILLFTKNPILLLYWNFCASSYWPTHRGGGAQGPSTRAQGRRPRKDPTPPTSPIEDFFSSDLPAEEEVPLQPSFPPIPFFYSLPDFNLNNFFHWCSSRPAGGGVQISHPRSHRLHFNAICGVGDTTTTRLRWRFLT
jgi:hypothetical protein